MNNGYELETLGKLSNMLSIPIIAFGGAFEKIIFTKVLNMVHQLLQLQIISL